MLKFSIITAVRNGVSTIGDCVISVSEQSANVEHIVVDCCSNDGTVDVVKKNNSNARIISETDNGIYDALNKGIRLSTGDVIGFLHADDCYAGNKVLETVDEAISLLHVDSCYGDLVYTDKQNINKIVRYWKACNYRDELFQYGWMPPHPTFFVKRHIYEKYGLFDCGYKIAADYELMLRFLVKHRISTTYIPETLIKMRMGGASNRSLRNLFIKTSEDYKAWSSNGLPRKWYTIPFKNFSKIPQFFSCGSKA